MEGKHWVIISVIALLFIFFISLSNSCSNPHGVTVGNKPVSATTVMTDEERNSQRDDYSNLYEFGDGSNNTGETRNIPEKNRTLVLDDFHERTLSKDEMIRYTSKEPARVLFRASDTVDVFINNSDTYKVLKYDDWHIIENCSVLEVKIPYKWTFVQIGKETK